MDSHESIDRFPLRSLRNVHLLAPRPFRPGRNRPASGKEHDQSVRLRGPDSGRKKYKTPNPFNRIVYTFFRKDKARRAFDHARELQRRGFETPEAAVWIRIARGGLFADGYFVSLYCDYRPLRPVLNPTDPKRMFSEYTPIYDALVRFIVSLHEAGVLHKDLNQTNILYLPVADGLRFALIDINRMVFRKKLSRRRCLLNLDRLGCDLDTFLYLSRNYSRLRGWDQTRGLLASILDRRLFEKRQQDKNRLKKHLRKNRK